MGQYFQFWALRCTTIRHLTTTCVTKLIKTGQAVQVGQRSKERGWETSPSFWTLSFLNPWTDFHRYGSLYGSTPGMVYPQVGMLIVIMVVSTIVRLCPQLKIVKYKHYKHYKLLEKLNNFCENGVWFLTIFKITCASFIHRVAEK